MWTQRMRSIAVGLAATLYATSASAGVMFFVNDQGGFNTEVLSLVSVGTEDFESSTLGADMITNFGDSLQPGVANGPFSGGTLAALGMTVQSNTNPTGDSSSANNVADVPTLQPRGAQSLSSSSVDNNGNSGDGSFGTPSDQVGPTFREDSLDLLFSPALLAVSLNPLFVDGTSFPPQTGSIFVEVYDDTNTFLGDVEVAGAGYGFQNSPLAFLGIVATGGDTIGRINLSDGNTIDWSGVDNVTGYEAGISPGPGPGPGGLGPGPGGPGPGPGPNNVPEPGAVLLIAGGLAAMAVRRRRR